MVVRLGSRAWLKELIAVVALPEKKKERLCERKVAFCLMITWMILGKSKMGRAAGGL
jgi:hypothetical protein